MYLFINTLFACKHSHSNQQVIVTRANCKFFYSSSFFLRFVGILILQLWFCLYLIKLSEILALTPYPNSILLYISIH